ncbi:hypothetical protein N9D31_01420 [Oligoflexaceae bacterium]|nr:hypothetical protein [Oligoflexaceae bacterium]
MSSNFSSSSLSDGDFVLAYADEFIGDMLPKGEKDRYEKLAKEEKYAKMLESYEKEHGKYQVFIQAKTLAPTQMESLWNLVQEPGARQTREMQKIDEVGRLEFFSNLKRRSLLILFFAALVFGIVYAFTSQQPPKFEYLEYIRYEALAMDRSGTKEELDLVDEDAKNILDLYKSDKGMKFTPSILSIRGEGWSVVGGSILDYELKKITMTQFRRKLNGKNQSLYYFSTSGTLSDLPQSEEGRSGEVRYQTYESEFYNIVAFAPADDTLGFVLGSLDAPSLASLADKGLIK